MTALLLFLALLFAALAALVYVGYRLAPKRPSEVKERRFEAGNPPYGEVKRRLVAQYVGYIYLVTAVEAVAGLLIVYALLSGGASPSLFAALALSLVAVAAFVAAYLRVIGDIKRWS